jgi:hypothetical protein
MNRAADAEMQQPDGFPERLRGPRRSRRFSQSQPGAVARLHHTHISPDDGGFFRPASDSLQRLAEVLAVSVDCRIERASEQAALARLEDRALLDQFQEVERLSDDDTAVAKTVRHAFLAKHHPQQIAAR